eukprot:8887861-Pyramimonas_sp.AAC.1
MKYTVVEYVSYSTAGVWGPAGVLQESSRPLVTPGVAVGVITCAIGDFICGYGNGEHDGERIEGRGV